MTKFFFVFFVIISSANCFAFTKNSYFLTENDTLNKQYFDSLSYKTYASPGGGFVSGNNAYLDRSKAQEFNAGNLCNIYAVMIHFGYKSFTSLSDSSYVGVNFYHIDNLGRNSIVSNAVPCPGTVFYKDSIKVSDIDTLNGNLLLYNSPIFTDSYFAIGIDFDQLNALDTIALYTNKDGDSGAREQSWEQDASGNWYTLKYNWPLTVDYAIFPIVNTSVGIALIANKKPSLILSPNPTSIGEVNINISKSLVKSINVYNSNLQLINSKNIAKDNFNLTVELETQSPGIYFIEVNTKNNIYFEKLIVE
jgi:hypothetical protein